MRAETGPMEFNNDWRGIFIRGDSCMHYMRALQMAIMELENPSGNHKICSIILSELSELLKSSNHHNSEPVQKMRKFEECNDLAMAKSVIDK